jgi:sugar phosphate permease
MYGGHHRPVEGEGGVEGNGVPTGQSELFEVFSRLREGSWWETWDNTDDVGGV